MSTKPTLLRVLVSRRHLQRYESFLPWFTRSAQALADQEREPRLASVTIGRRQYERWLAGNVVRKPYPDSCRVLEHMFACTVDELFGPAGEPRMGAVPTDVAAARASMPVTTHGEADVAVPALMDPSGVAAADVAGGMTDDGLWHRPVLRGLGADVSPGLTAPALEVIDAIRRSMDATLTDQGGLDLLEEWERRADDHTHAYQVTPPVSLLRDAVLDFADVQAALRQGQFGGHRVRLWAVLARLAGMIGVCLTVLGQHRDARAWFHTGRRAANLCEDGPLQAWMYTRSAVVSLHFGTPASALALADKAVALHRGPSGTAVRTHLVRARALARMGDRVNAWSALRQARASFELLDHRETSDKVFGHTERQLLAHSGSAATSLRDTRAARRLQEQALAGYGPAEHMDPALARIEQGLCLLWESDPTGACRHVVDAISALPTEHRTGIVRVYARTFVMALTPDQQRLRAGEELREFLRSAFVDRTDSPAVTAGVAG